MNTKAKGRRAEIKTCRWLEAQGYQCMRSAASLGAFDVAAFKKTGTLLIQVKAGSSAVSKVERERLESFPAGPFVVKVLHLWKPRAREPEVHYLNAHLEREINGEG